MVEKLGVYEVNIEKAYVRAVFKDGTDPEYIVSKEIYGSESLARKTCHIFMMARQHGKSEMQNKFKALLDL